MDTNSEIREFMTAGLPAFGDNRRVPGLRREEVAMLAGVSVDFPDWDRASGTSPSRSR